MTFSRPGSSVANCRPLISQASLRGDPHIDAVFVVRTWLRADFMHHKPRIARHGFTHAAHPDS
jgi:hypothetical protein